MINIANVLKNWGFQEAIIEKQFHEDTSRKIYSFTANDKRMLLKGIPDEISEKVIKGNVAAHEYLGNLKHIAPAIIHTVDENSYIHVDGYWFYVMEFMNTFGPYAVEPLWNILKFGMSQKEKLWNILNHR